jgi:hypothetical protein
MRLIEERISSIDGSVLISPIADTSPVTDCG